MARRPQHGRRWQHGSPSSAAQPALASGGAPQPSCLPGSAEQPADESYPRVWDGELYTRAEFREHFGWYLGEARWHSALDWWEVSAIEAPRRRSPEQPVGTMTSVARDDAAVIRIGTPRRRSVEQPASSLNLAAQLAENVHSAVHAKLTEYMTFVSRILNDVYDIWRSEGEPKRARSSWSSQWNNLTRMLEAIARDAAANNCLHELDLSLSSVVQPASIEKLTATAALLARKVRTTCKKEAEFLLLLDRLALVTVHKACWAEVERFFESNRGDDAAFNTRCASEAARELNECNLRMKNVAAEARRLLDVPSWTASSPA